MCVSENERKRAEEKHKEEIARERGRVWARDASLKEEIFCLTVSGSITS